MLKDPRFWGKFFPLVVAPAAVALGGIIMDLVKNPPAEHSSPSE
jgi:hypothetical protein